MTSIKRQRPNNPVKRDIYQHILIDLVNGLEIAIGYDDLNIDNIAGYFFSDCNYNGMFQSVQAAKYFVDALANLGLKSILAEKIQSKICLTTQKNMSNLQTEFWGNQIDNILELLEALVETKNENIVFEAKYFYPIQRRARHHLAALNTLNNETGMRVCYETIIAQAVAKRIAAPSDAQLIYAATVQKHPELN